MGALTNVITKATDRFFDHNRGRRPTQVVIETTNRCNLNCPYCLAGMQNELMEKHGTVSHDLMTRPLGLMSLDTFSKVRKELRAFGIKKAYLHFQGEPFLNKHTPYFAKQLKKDGLKVGIFTNGQAFNDNIIQEIAKAEIDLIRFSVDGASEETYQQNRVGGKFSKVYENMKKTARAHVGKETRIEWQFVPLRNNEHEVEEARQMSKDIGVLFLTKAFRETDLKLVPKNLEYRSEYLKKPCKDIYKQIGIYWNGDVVPCCYDVDGKEVMGNVNEAELQDIWRSKKYVEFRKVVDKSKIDPKGEPGICKTCLRWK